MDIKVQPRAVLDENAPLILILAGSDIPETTFVCQLLNHAVETAASIALKEFIQPHCRVGSGRVQLSCLSAAAMSDFDESLYSHVTVEEVDRFISDHAISKSTLCLAESYAKTAVLGAAGSSIVQDLLLDAIPEFLFKDDVQSSNFIIALDKGSLLWQPTPINPQIQVSILLL